MSAPEHNLPAVRALRAAAINGTLGLLQARTLMMFDKAEEAAKRLALDMPEPQRGALLYGIHIAVEVMQDPDARAAVERMVEAARHD